MSQALQGHGKGGLGLWAQPGVLQELEEALDGFLVLSLVQVPGGGGYGDPLQRDPSRVLDDVLDGFVSPQSAREQYGVVIDGAEVDAAATAALRIQLRADGATAT